MNHPPYLIQDENIRFVKLLFSSPRQYAVELVQQVVWRLAQDLSVELSDQLVVVHHLRGFRQTLTAL